MNCMSSTRRSSRRSIAWMGAGTNMPGHTMPSGLSAPRSLVQVGITSTAITIDPVPVTYSVVSTDHDAHQAHRRAIAPFFSKSNVASRQELICRNVDKFCQRLSKLAGTRFNLGAATSAFTRDVANEFIVGKAYNELDLDDFGIGLSIASQGAGVFWRTTKHIRWFGPAMRAIPVEWAMKMADEGTKSFLRYLQVSLLRPRSRPLRLALLPYIFFTTH